ncbi:MAG: response regulator [Planctomycetaceae bacterium]
MSKSRGEAADPLAVLEEALNTLPGDASQLATAQTNLKTVADSAREAGRVDVARFASTIGGLLDLLDAQSGGATDGELDEISRFVREGVGPLRAALNDDSDAAAQIQEALDVVEQRWGEYLSLMEPETGGAGEEDIWANAIGADHPDSWNNESDGPSPKTSREEIEKLMASLPSGGPSKEQKKTKSPTGARKKPEIFGRTSGLPPDGPPPAADIDIDADLLDAYGEDARAGAARLEQIVLELEGRPDDPALHQSICRELHTLKGASASVGLTELGDYLHRVEDYVEASKGEAIDVAPLLQSVDAVRRQLDALAGRLAATANPSTGGGAELRTADSTSPSSFEPTAGREESLRVKASRVDRLMDLLAELVILRNQRDSRLNRLKNLHAELTRCVTRLHVFADGFETGLPIGTRGGASPSDLDAGQSGRASGSFVEIANDVAEFARSLRDLSEPMEAENVTISHFIRQFRTELMEMRRMPVSGLFQRLNRAARDAARIENKKIEFRLEGEHAGLDRSLQERLYEPLLHLIRNAVSHGVEPPDVRRNAGKPETGTITLSASGSPTTLIIEITDDGRGLDFEAIRRRGLDRGLIGVGESMEESRLARLIFHPGFSTRTETNAVAGRGVGMDVVAAALQRMRAKIDVDSRSGVGTAMRLTIPLRSVIEHAMVVRVAGRLFAVPMQFVQAAGPLQRDEARRRVRLRAVLGLNGALPPAQEHVVVLGSGRLSFSMTVSGARKTGDPADAELALVVDDVIGPDEVVVRSLPSLLKPHPCLGGVTLSGDGDIVQLLDGQRLMDLALACSRSDVPDPNATTDRPATDAASRHNEIKALVVDDSLSARRRIVKMLQGAGCDVSEAGDGREAIARFRTGEFQVVFTDIEMPNVDGFGVLSEIKGGPLGKSTPVVVASSRSESEFRERAAEMGADDYLVKPVTAAALAETLLKIKPQLTAKVEN